MRDDNEQLKIELLSHWKLEAESRNITSAFLCDLPQPWENENSANLQAP